jgi:hypothetical protein
MKVEIAELRTITERLLTHLEANGQSSVEIPVEYYWHLTKEQRYDSYLSCTFFSPDN